MFYNFKKAPADTLPDELFIDGEIASEQSWWGDATVAREFRKALKACKDVTVYINSPGGDVFAGAEIYTALRDHPGRVTVKILGIAASAASVIAMAGDEVLMSPVSYMMIHDPWTYAVGNYREMAHMAEVLKEIGEGIIAAYTAKTGRSRYEIAKMLESETYMSAQTAIDEGFADGLLFEPSASTQNPAEKNSQKGTLMRASRYSPSAICAMVQEKDRQEEDHPAHTHTLFSHMHMANVKRKEAASELTVKLTVDASQLEQSIREQQETDERAEIALRAQIIAETTGTY